MPAPEVSPGAKAGQWKRARKEIEGAFKLKRTLLCWMLAVVPAALMPLSAMSQVNPDSAPASSSGAFRYTGYAGFAYTGLNQINQSRYGLIGGKGSLTRNWGKYFGLSGVVDYNKPPISNSSDRNPGDPSVYSLMVAPELHTNIYGSLSGLFFLELGIEHTGGEGMSPSTSFAGGFGGGLEYNLNRRFAIRAEGDRVGASFPVTSNFSQTGQTEQEEGDSTHRTWNGRASIGVVYHF
jgi:Outer membrane protein beta-barrel domain